jgi:hypothetical protein
LPCPWERKAAPERVLDRVELDGLGGGVKIT